MHTNTHTRAYMHRLAYLHTKHIHIHIYGHTHTHRHTCTQIYTDTETHAHILLHRHTFIHTCTDIYTHTHTHTGRSPQPFPWPLLVSAGARSPQGATTNAGKKMPTAAGQAPVTATHTRQRLPHSSSAYPGAQKEACLGLAAWRRCTGLRPRPRKWTITRHPVPSW